MNMDLIRIYKKCLSHNEVKNNYKLTKECHNRIITDNLVLHVDAFNPDSYTYNSTIWNDLSGNGINGHLSNQSIGTTEYGTMILDGSSYYITFNHNTILEPSNITINAWVNLEDIDNRHVLLTKWYGWSFEIKDTGNPYLRIHGSNIMDLISNTPIDWNKWYYISSTFDDINNIRNIYINGINTGSVVDTGSISYDQHDFKVPYASTYSKGKISSIQIYDRALTELEIKHNFNVTKNNYGY
jgi:hypothetical protein